MSFNGASFSAPQNLTNTPNCDERFFSLATRNPDSRARILYQCSATNEAGCVIIGDRGTSPGNVVRRIAYLEAPLTASVLAAPASSVVARPLRVAPNPAFAGGRIRFEASPWSSTRTFEVHDLLGRRIAELPLPPNAPAVEWSGRDTQGHAAPAGVYFVHLREEAASPAVRFVLAR